MEFYRMDDLLRVRVPAAEKRAIANAAKRRGISISEFIRTVASEAAERVSA